MTSPTFPDWYVSKDYLKFGDGSTAKTIDDVYKWHMSRDEQDKYDEFGYLYHNVGEGAAVRFAQYANLNPVLRLLKDSDFEDNKVPDILRSGAPALEIKLSPFFNKKYKSMNRDDKDLFEAWYTIEKNKFYTKEQRIDEQRILYAKDELKYIDVLSYMLARPPLAYDADGLPDYSKYFQHMRNIEFSVIFQKWVNALEVDEKFNNKERKKEKPNISYELSRCIFDKYPIQLLALFDKIFVVPPNEDKGRERDTRELTRVHGAMGAYPEDRQRAWSTDEKTIRLLKRSRETANRSDLAWFRSIQRARSGAPYDFGPGLLEYNTYKIPYSNHYIGDNVYHTIKAPNIKDTQKTVISGPPNAYVYKS